MVFVPSLVLGLVENLDAAERFVGQWPWSFWCEIKNAGSRMGLDVLTEKKELGGLILEMLDIAEEGLRVRGCGEEMFLGPGYTRLATRRIPADDAMAAFVAGGVTRLVNATRLW
jgi:hypothetical protein